MHQVPENEYGDQYLDLSIILPNAHPYNQIDFQVGSLLTITDSHKGYSLLTPPIIPNHNMNTSWQSHPHHFCSSLRPDLTKQEKQISYESISYNIYENPEEPIRVPNNKAEKQQPSFLNYQKFKNIINFTRTNFRAPPRRNDLIVDFGQESKMERNYHYHNFYGYSDPINPMKISSITKKNSYHFMDKAGSTLPPKTVSEFYRMKPSQSHLRQRQISVPLKKPKSKEKSTKLTQNENQVRILMKKNDRKKITVKKLKKSRPKKSSVQKSSGSRSKSASLAKDTTTRNMTKLDSTAAIYSQYFGFEANKGHNKTKRKCSKNKSRNKKTDKGKTKRSYQTLIYSEFN